MAFLALTSAPVLDKGVVLNIMAVPQVDGTAPPEIDSGATLTIRFGHCCPDLAQAEIVSRAMGRAVLMLSTKKHVSDEPRGWIPEPAPGRGWILEPLPGKSGIAIPGIVSENWVVLGAVAQSTKESRDEDRLLRVN